MNDDTGHDPHSGAWNFQVWASFAVALAMTLAGIVLGPSEIWVKGYLLMGTMFTVGSTFTLAKTVRDNLETRKYRNRVRKARTEQLLHEFEEAA